ncbi:MAG: Ig domain-containing protein [Defluviicoccus sp.]|nr:Ig domain-containing protein [Defluviicoccus sp.]
MNYILTGAFVSLAIALAACGGGGHLSVENPGGRGKHETDTLVFWPDQPIEYRLPFSVSGGIPPYESSIEGCPDWVTIFPDQRILAGTAPATAAGRAFFCTYRVTESEPGFREKRSVTHGLRLRVGSPASNLELPKPNKVNLSVGTFDRPLLPRASGGVEPYAYSFVCAGGALPSGMGFAPETRILAGTPDAVFRDFCTYTVTDSGDPAATVSRAVEVEVRDPRTGTLMLGDTSKVALSVGTFDRALLPPASGGVGPYAYSFACAGGALPSGMGFAPETRILAGTPDALFRDSCTYSVTDSGDPAATVSRAVEVEVAGRQEPLDLTRVFEDIPGDELTLKIGRRSRTEFGMASGGVEPYTSEVIDCTLPAGLEFHPNTRVLSGTPNAEYRGANCTYRVTDSSSPPASVSLSFVLTVEPLEASDWRFRTRTVEPGQGLCVVPGSGAVRVATLPAAHAGEGAVSYALPGAPAPRQAGALLSFDPGSRVLTYANPAPPPVLGTPNTYRYLAGTAAGVDGTNADDALCLDVQYNSGAGLCPADNEATPPLLPGHQIHIQLRVRDDAFWDEHAKEYRCPDTAPPPPRPSPTHSNPVHEALGPVHARRALDVAHGSLRDRVRGWTPGAPRLLSAIAPKIGIGSLSGESDGFDYTGWSESVSTGAEIGSGSWQAGVVGSFTRTELHYRAAASLAGRGYRSGEHTTEILSLHPFAAWHMPSGAHVWTSLGAGAGELSHRDELGFPSRSRSDVRLRAYAAGASVPVADFLSGELEAEAGIEGFAFEIEGGGRISSALPTMRGRDWRSGLAWSAPVAGAPSVSMAYRHLTGDGPEGGQLEARASVSVDGIIDPRLALTGQAEGSVGLGGNEHRSWGLSSGIRFASGQSRRGFGLELDTRLDSLDRGRPPGVGARGEAGYGVWTGSPFGTIRPYIGLVRHSTGNFPRRTVGVDVRHRPDSHARLEFQDRRRSRDLRFSLRHRF